MNLYLRFVYFLLVHKLRQKRHQERRQEHQGKTDPLETHVVPYRVWPSDLDFLMHMTNSKYFALMDLSRVNFMVASGMWNQINVRGWYPVVAAQWMDYYRSLAFFQKFTVETTVVCWDDKFVYMRQDFVSGGKKCASALVCARFLKKAGGGVDPDELIEAMGQTGIVSPPMLPEVAAWRARRG